MRWLGVVLVMLVSCQKEPPRPLDEHPPIAPAEVDRGLALCQGYADRVCACAAQDPSLAEACALAKSEPEAVAMHLDVLRGAPLADFGGDGKPKDAGAELARRPPLNDSERRLTESSLRKVVAGCVAADAQLPKSCARPTPPTPAAQP